MPSTQFQYLTSRRSITGNTEELFFVDSVEGVHLLVMLVEKLVRSLELSRVETSANMSLSKNLRDVVDLNEDELATTSANFKLVFYFCFVKFIFY